jgi:NitT/TauT family transport system permease protein
MNWLIAGALIWALGWYVNVRLAALPKSRVTSLLVPVIFGVTLIIIWECVVLGLQIQQVL